MKLRNITTAILTAAILGMTINCSKKVTPDDWDYSRFLMNEGIRELNLGNMAKAEKKLILSIEKNPWNVQSSLILRSIYVRQGRFDSAIDIIEDMKKDDYWKYNQLGILQWKKGDAEKAFSLFNDSIEENRDYPTPYFYMGRMLFDQERPGEARKKLNKYQALFPRYPGRKGEENLMADAENLLIRINFPDEADRYFTALDHFNNDRHRKSMEILSRLSSPPALTLRGRILRCYGKNAEAEKVLSPLGEYVPARLLLGEIYLLKNSSKSILQAEGIISSVLEQNPDNQKANFIMGRLLHSSNREEDARSYFKKSFSIGSDENIALEASNYLNIGIDADSVYIDRITVLKKLVVKDRAHAVKMKNILHRLRRAVPGNRVSFSIVLDIYRDSGRNINALSLNTGETGYIFISQDLISFVESLPIQEDQKNSVFACIIGHELHHILEKHAYRAYSLNGILTGQVSGSDSERKYTVMKAMNQAHEFESDRYGAMYAYLAGYNPYMIRYIYHKIISKYGDINKNENHPTYRERIASLNEKLTEFKFSFSHFRKGLLKLPPGKDESPGKAGKRLAAAEHSFRTFLKTFPENVAALNNMGLVYLQKALVGTVKEKLTYSTSIILSPGLVDPARLEILSMRRSSFMNLAQQAIKVKKADSKMLKLGEKYFTMALKKKQSTKAMNNLGIIYAYMDRHEDAAVSFKKSITLDPGSFHAVNNLGICLIKLGKQKEGQLLIQKAARHGLSTAALNISRGFYNFDK